ncbi:rho GTPase-activating protein 6-like isoform X1 [Sinocyclocheilus rhinocerous]|uniref:rho GTPase-activating protein 6-like isoform X1 n=1 Tax=Sinocyclocheilus rhinocerous TaxID=307959 RepID=UPI0007BAB939|nr:PREDICTED: rho GTPase-activating protein 6-like isoform X1 [Sinocyclocheilus rhinocerous]
MSAQGLLNSVFSCSSSGSKTLAKRNLHQTRSLDSALIRHCATPGDASGHRSFCWSSSSTAGFTNSQSASESLAADPRLKPRLSTSSLSASSDASSISSLHLDYRSGKRNASRDLSLHLSASSNIFSPRKWLQRKLPQSDAVSHNICKSEGDFTCKKTAGHNFHMQSVSIQGLSELERVRLQEVALVRLMKDFDLGCQITIPKDGQKRKKSLRRKLDSLSKEKRDKESDSQAFGVPLSQVIVNDRRHKQLQEEQEEQRSPSDRVSSLLHLMGRRSTNKELSSSNSSLSSSSETPNEGTTPSTPETALRSRRRGGVSVDCITDLDDSHSRLLEALQLSMPVESHSEKKKKTSDAKLSLNPIYRQVPRVLDSCCQHLQKYGLQTVGIFRVGSSKKRVRQLREAFDQGADVVLDQRHSVHDVAALLKEFLRDMPDPLLTRELYSAFISCASLDKADQYTVIQLLICLLPACNSDTLQCLLHFLSDVANHAEDSRDADGNEVIGNKMTSLNLATIFGPNLLHKQKSSEKEFSVESSARMEDSAAIISVVQHMIDTHQSLFTISAELQNELLLSLLDTDSDVVHYLLRRKTPQCEDVKSSSGEISPYDNNSPVLSEWFHPSGPEHQSPTNLQHALERNNTVNFCLSPSQAGAGETIHDKARIWRTRHALLSGLHDKLLTGSDGHLYKRASSDVFYDDDNDMKPVHEMQTSYTNVTAECRARLQVTSAGGSPLSSPRHQMHPIALSRTAFHQSEEAMASPAKPDDILPAVSMQPRVTSCQGAASHVPSKSFGPEQHPDWPTEKWQIWQLLSSDSIDTLPETMV